MGESSTSERRLNAAEKRREALKLRKAGATFDAIAKEVGYRNRSAAWKAVQQELAALPKEDATAVRELELARLDAVLMANWGRALNGDDKAARIILAVMDRRSRYLGLDAPTKLHHGVEEGESMIGGLMDKLREVAGPPPDGDHDPAG